APLRRAPPSTLFPYTTLFRSVIVAHVAPDEVGPEIDRQDDVRPHRPAQGDRDRVDDASVDQIAIVVRNRTKQARHGYGRADRDRSEEHTSELQSRSDLVCRLL